MLPVGREGFTVRVLRDGSFAPAGVGFVVGDQHILTCAHVVNAALGRDQRIQEKPGDDIRIQIEFAMLGNAEGGPVRNCRVDVWVPPPKSGVAGGDIAGLVLVGESLPEGAGSARLDPAPPHSSEVEVFGYPDEPSRWTRGTWTALHLRGMVGGRLIQLDDNSTSAIRAQPGYSGSPVIMISNSDDSVAGMLAITSLDRDSGDAYAIPVSQLTDAWPDVLADRSIPPSPYRSMRPFTAADTALGLFVGRNEEIRRLHGMVTQQPLVAIAGDSGAGKTSLVAAGLIPVVEDDGWLTAAFRPGLKPISAFAKTLAVLDLNNRALTSDDLARWTSRLQSEELSELGSELALLRGKPILVHVDQLEEIFDPAICPPEMASRFLSLLTGMQQARGDNLHIICALRSDSLPNLTEYPDAGNRLLERMFMLPSMSRSSIREVITQPAEAAGVHFEDGLAERIATDLGGSNGLGLLEVTLEELWRHQRRRRIALSDYQGIDGFAGILSGYAERAYHKLQERFPAKRIRRVLLALIRSRESPATATARVVTQGFLGQDWEVVQALASHRLVILGYDSGKGAVTAEITHVALIRQWPTLASWIEEDAEFQHWLAALDDRARDDGILPGILTDEADRWLGERANDIPPELAALAEQGIVGRQMRADQVARRRGEDRRRRLRAIIADVTAVADGLQAPSAPFRRIEERLAGDSFRVMVVGELNGGKSTLINAIIGSSVLPAAARPITAVLTEFHWSALPRAVLYPADDGIPVEVEPKDLAHYILMSAGAAPSQWKLIEVGWPLDMLSNGVVLIDSPGTNNSLDMNKVTLAELSRADAIVLVSDVQSAMSLEQRRFVMSYLDYRDIFFVFNKIDRLPPDEIIEVKEDVVYRVQEFRDERRDRYYFVNALAGLGARINRNDATWRASGVAGFVHELREFLATEPYRTQLMSLATAARHQIRELNQPISEERTYIDQAKADLRYGYQAARLSRIDRDRKPVQEDLRRQLDERAVTLAKWEKLLKKCVDAVEDLIADESQT